MFIYMWHLKNKDLFPYRSQWLFTLFIYLFFVWSPVNK